VGCQDKRISKAKDPVPLDDCRRVPPAQAKDFPSIVPNSEHQWMYFLHRRTAWALPASSSCSASRDIVGTLIQKDILELWQQEVYSKQRAWLALGDHSQPHEIWQLILSEGT
jgi:hypothetical protein